MRQLLPLLAVSAIALSTAAAYADLGDQLFKLLPDDGVADDHFGDPVAISGAGDLAELLGAWGAKTERPADFNGDAVIDATDLAVLLGAWGTCP